VLARQPTLNPDLIDPFADDPTTPAPKPAGATPPAPLPATPAPASPELRQKLLETLDGRDAILFLSRLRALSPDERAGLRDDGEFWKELRHRLAGMAFWTVQLIVQYGARHPDEVNALSAAIHSGDHQRTRTLLMGYETLRSVLGLREVIASRFPAKEADDLRAVLAETQHRAESGYRKFKEAMYDEGEVKKYTGERNYELVRLTNSVRVIVRINLTEDPANTTTGATDDVVGKWEAAISKRWNNKFRLRCASKTLDLWFVPVFVYHDDNAHFQVKVTADNQRADETNWHSLRDPDHAAHEFGHMLGNPDEYSLPGSMAEIPNSLGLSDAEKRRSSWEGIFGTAKPATTEGYDVKGLLGNRYQSQDVAVRHAWDILETFNANLRQSGEDPWTVELKP
jgi:hypothetical protein